MGEQGVHGVSCGRVLEVVVKRVGQFQVVARGFHIGPCWEEGQNATSCPEKRCDGVHAVADLSLDQSVVGRIRIVPSDGLALDQDQVAMSMVVR
ncbi:MAG: hypothetical protein CME82_15425 [Halomonas sp.]|nr:hypothetical protein [Halomonas sp.]|tara:strand:- start:2127 stop:2408 length:282 start_codon:yes stop_codon:yes gene_type:complete